MIETFFQLSQNYILNYQQEYVRYFLKTHDLSNRFSIISGQRGVGKTTAIIQYLQTQYPNLYTTKALYIQADVASDEIERGFGNKIPLWVFWFLY